MKKIIFLLSVGMLAIFSCKHEPMIPPSNQDPTPKDTIPWGSTAVCFSKDILPIFESYCAKGGCHDNVSRVGGYILDSYDNIIKKDIKPGNAANSKIYRVIITTDPGDIMPPPGSLPLTQSQKDIIKKWIDEGAKNTACTVTCDANLYTYSGFIQPLLQTNCNGCHSGSGASGNIDLTNYASVKQLC